MHGNMCMTIFHCVCNKCTFMQCVNVCSSIRLNLCTYVCLCMCCCCVWIVISLVFPKKGNLYFRLDHSHQFARPFLHYAVLLHHTKTIVLFNRFHVYYLIDGILFTFNKNSILFESEQWEWKWFAPLGRRMRLREGTEWNETRKKTLLIEYILLYQYDCILEYINMRTKIHCHRQI